MLTCGLESKQKRVELTVGECELHKEERHELEETKKIHEYDMEKFTTIDISSERTFTIPGDRRRSQKVKQEGDKIN